MSKELSIKLEEVLTGLSWDNLNINKNKNYSELNIENIENI